MGMIVVNILILMLFIAALLGFWHLKQSTEKSYKNLLDTKNSLEEQVKSYKNETKNLQNLHREDNNQILKLTENLAEIQVSYLELERKLENDSNLAKVKEELDRLNGIVNDSVAYIDKLNDEIKTKNDLLTNTIAAQHASEGAQEKIAREIERLRVELNNVEVLLKQRKEIMRRSTLEGVDLNLFTLDLKPKERRIIELIQGLKVECAELSEDLANIEGKKVGLPKMQSMCKALGADVKGIYRLVCKEDEKVCYVGQAINIKERGYQHVKKMIGVSGKGNEKLYNYRPDELLWEIVECGDSIDLNYSEKYGIEYYAAIEVGLNSKG